MGRGQQRAADGRSTFGNDGYILTTHGLMADDAVQERSKAGYITMHADYAGAALLQHSKPQAAPHTYGRMSHRQAQGYCHGLLCTDILNLHPFFEISPNAPPPAQVAPMYD